jgi:hypothetical protein
MKSSSTTAVTSVPRPKIRKAPRDPSRLTSQPRFWPKNPVRNDSGRNMVAMQRVLRQGTLDGRAGDLVFEAVLEQQVSWHDPVVPNPGCTASID